MARPNTTHLRIVKLLEENGPMSQLKIMEKLSDLKPSTVACTIRKARGKRDGYEDVKTMYVVDYDRHFGLAGQPSPIIALGNLPCKPMPDINPEVGKKGRWTRYNAKVSKRRAEVRRAKNAANLVFQNMVNPPRIRQDKNDLKELPAIRHELVDDEALV
jgi:DNA-binding Lrp family transcriptional regulator